MYLSLSKFVTKNRSRSCSNLKRSIFAIIFLSLATVAYIVYVPYDFTINALASIYVRCSTPTVGNLNLNSNALLLFELDQRKRFDFTNEKNDILENLSVLKSRFPWTGVFERRIIAYSAYRLEKSNLIRILVLKHVDECRPVLCHYFNFDNKTATKNFSKNGSLNYHLNKLRRSPIGIYDLIRLDCFWDCPRFESFFIDCPIIDNYDSSIDFVNLIPLEYSTCFASDQNVRETWPRIPVRSIIDFEKSINHNLTMCVAPMFDYVDGLKFALFVEYYRRQGASRFVIYKRSWSPSVQRIIDYYRFSKIIDLEIIDWPLLPSILNGTKDEINILNKHVSYHGQVLAMNDCGYRERRRSRFVAHIDLDEFILPFPSNSKSGDQKDEITLLSLLIDLDQTDIGSFVFEHVRLYTDLAPITGDQVISDQIIDNQKNRYLNADAAMAIRSPTINHFPSRSKSIVKPESIMRQGIHFVWTHESGFRKFLVPNARALFYHMTSMKNLPKDLVENDNDKEEVKLFMRLIRNVQENVNLVVRNSQRL